MLRLPIKLVADYWFVLSLIILAVITTLSLSPLPELPEVPGNDKLHHLIAYASLAIPIALSGSPRKGHPQLIVILLFYILWGGGLEVLQPYLNRYGEWADFFVNTVGVAIGTLIGWMVRVAFKSNLK
jgi:VanZ family protein